MSEMSPIPFVDLVSQYKNIRSEILPILDELMASASFVQGARVSRFERDFADCHGAQFALGCSNGTSAISIALEALGVGTGDEVITVTNTFIATAEAICHVGAKPVFVDIDPKTHQMNPELLEAVITANTKALIPVHLYGGPADMDPILEVARKHRLCVIEDAAQAHLAEYKGRKVGTFGNAATFSFYPGKNLGAYGDAGMIFCSDSKLHDRMKKLINHGRTQKYSHDLIGYNQRMDEIQAAVLSVKLKYLPGWTETRRQLASYYLENLKKAGFRTVTPTEGSNPVYHLFVVEVSNRAETIREMEELRISCQVHYPIPLHLQPAFGELGYRRGDFPVAEKAADRIMSLPLCGELSMGDAERVLKVFLRVARP